MPSRLPEFCFVCPATMTEFVNLRLEIAKFSVGCGLPWPHRLTVKVKKIVNLHRRRTPAVAVATDKPL